MTTIPLALRFLLLVVSGWVSRQQHDVIELWSCTTSWDIPPTGGETAAGLAKFVGRVDFNALAANLEAGS